jgi:hypothetical protein
MRNFGNVKDELRLAIEAVVDKLEIQLLLARRRGSMGALTRNPGHVLEFTIKTNVRFHLHARENPLLMVCFGISRGTPFDGTIRCGFLHS